MSFFDKNCIEALTTSVTCNRHPSYNAFQDCRHIFQVDAKLTLCLSKLCTLKLQSWCYAEDKTLASLAFEITDVILLVTVCEV